jgi:site-specific recombinase XerD
MNELNDFSEYLIAKGYSGKSASSIVNSTQRFIIWLQTVNTEHITINYNDVMAYIKHLQRRSIKAITIQLETSHIKKYLNYLVQAGIIPHNPVLTLKLKHTKSKTLHHIISPEELENIYKSYSTQHKQHLIAPPQQLNTQTRKRNKILLGLIIYQGLTAEDIANIELQHLELREGKITIPGTRRSNERSLKLEAHQIFDLYDYINDTRKALLSATGKQSTQLIVSKGSGTKTQNTLQRLFSELRTINPKLKNLDQLRASVITNWLKLYNKRKVQYMAGHRYVSSTERYQPGNIEALQEDVEKYYPIS